MDRRFVITLVLSALFATFVAGILYRLAASPHTPRLTTHPVVIAAVNLTPGSRIRSTDLKLVSMPETMLPHNSFSRLEDVEERSVTSIIFKDEPVVQDRIAPVGSVPGLGPLIADGERAVSVRVNDVIGVAGFVQPGMRVDVLVTGRPPNSTDSITKTVLQNVLVLSAGQVLQPDPKGQAINATVVTLQVPPVEAEVLILASGEGHIQLILRNPGDSRRQLTPGTLLSSLYGEAPEPARIRQSNAWAPALRHAATLSPASPHMAAAPPSHVVEVIRGNRKSLDSVDSQDFPLPLPN